MTVKRYQNLFKKDLRITCVAYGDLFVSSLGSAHRRHPALTTALVRKLETSGQFMGISGDLCRTGSNLLHARPSAPIIDRQVSTILRDSKPRPPVKTGRGHDVCPKGVDPRPARF